MTVGVDRRGNHSSAPWLNLTRGVKVARSYGLVPRTTPFCLNTSLFSERESPELVKHRKMMVHG